MSNTLEEKLNKKIEWALASSLAAPAGSGSRMKPISGLEKVERDLQIGRVRSLILSEAHRIALQIIGEDEDSRYFTDYTQTEIVQDFEQAVENESRNELRVEQRERLSKITGVKD